MHTPSVFNLKRFGHLMAYDLKLNAQKYILAIAAFVILLYCWILFQMHQSPNQFMWHQETFMRNNQYYYTNTQGYVSSFFLALMAYGLFIGMSFTRWGNKIRRISYLQLPASTFEKYLHPFLVRIVAGASLFFLLFMLVAQLAGFTYNKQMSAFKESTQYHEMMALQNSGNVSTYTIQKMEYKPDAFSYGMLDDNQSKVPTPIVPIVFAFVSIGLFLFVVPMFFRKQALIKTILLFFIGVFLVACTFVLFSHLIYPDQTMGFNVHLDTVQLTKKYNSFDLAIYALVYSSWLFFLFIGYFKLKEMKV
jgi:hypothetical protein